jgi:hypothetical protein
MVVPDSASTYLDTNAWNRLLDWSARRSRSHLRGRTILFSSCNLDEIAGAGHYRAKDLASLAWDVSNKRKLFDHLELTVAEIRAHLRAAPDASPFDDDPRFVYSWKQVRTGSTSKEVADALKETMSEAKKSFQEHLRRQRELLRSTFRLFESLGVRKEWRDMLDELEGEGYIREHIAQNLEFAGASDLAREIRARDPRMYRSLPGTSCWVQYYMGLSFIACYEDGEQSKPDFGDQVDFRHAAYAGIADQFVTSDQRMRRILMEMVPSRHSSVLTFEEFIGTLT